MKKLSVLIIAVIGSILVTGCAPGAPQAGGNTAPDFQLKNLDGAAVTLSSQQGRPVLLNFWATWCGPCRAEMPFIQEIYQDAKWQARGLLILAVNLRESEAAVRKFVADSGYTFTVLLDTGGQVGRLYNISAIPTTHIINKDGIIKNSRVGAFTGKAQIEQMISASLTAD